MGNIDNGFRSEAFSLDDVVGIFYGTTDPSVSGFEAPVGSIFLSTNGYHYRKHGSNDTDWKKGNQIEQLTDIVDVNAPSPSDGQTLVWDAGTGKWIPYTIFIPGTGKRIVQIQTNTIDALSGTSIIPLDNTIPQITEGSQIWTQDITLNQSSNIIRLRTSFMASGLKANMSIVAALYADSTCIGSTVVTVPGNNRPTSVALEIYNTPASLGPITYSCRVGKDSGQGTWYVNRTDVDNILSGTTEKQSYTIEELENN